jgi:replicative DNA helicase
VNAAVKLAERATLGALMLNGEVELTRETVRRLRPADFGEPWHGELFRTIRDLAVERQTVDATAVGLALIERLGPNYAEAVRVADCLRIVPPNPDLRAYTAMVLEASTRREIAGLGVLVQAGALASVLEGSSRPLVTLTAVLDATLDAADRRTGDNLERLGTDPHLLGSTSLPGLSKRGWREQGVAADRLLGAHPMPQPEQIAAHEADLIAALIGRPSALGAVRSWLRPDAITDPTSQQVYRAMTHLADHGRPIDLVNVAWETGRMNNGPSDSVLLAKVEAAQPRSAGYLARIVACDHLRLHAQNAALAIDAAAEDPSRELWDVIGIARRQIRALRDAAPSVDVEGPVRSVSRLRDPVGRQAASVPEGRAG